MRYLADFSPTEFLVMRLITGDELGLLKEIVPELCRHSEDVDAGVSRTAQWTPGEDFFGGGAYYVTT